MRDYSFRASKEIAYFIPVILIVAVIVFFAPKEIQETERARVMISLIFASGAAGFLAISFDRYGDYYAPIGLFGGGWLGDIALTYLQLSPVYQPNWTVILWIAISLGIGSFLVGCISIDRMFGYEYDLQKNWVGTDKKTVYWAIVAIFLISYTIFLIQLMRLHFTVGLTTYLIDPAIAESQFWIFGIGYLYYLNFLNAPLSMGYLMKYGKDNIIVFIFILSLVAMPFHLIKTGIIASLFAMILIFHYTSRSYLRVWMLLISFCGLIGFFIIYAIVTGHTNSWFVQTGKIDLPRELSLLARPYLYAGTNIANLQVALTSNPNFSFGLRSLAGLLKLSIIYDVTGLPEQLKAARPTLNDAFLTNTYLGMLYLDFSWMGITFGSFIYGVWSQFIYKVARRTNSVAGWTLYGFIGFACAMSWFWNYWSEFWLLFFTAICTTVIYLSFYGTETVVPVELQLRNRFR